ncbi:hypothetical protein [Psychroserpens sp. S379A]|uniref:hypothetical protein n=1 Tax=Psychroserpens sp. S379A TaxID=3415137 RepID=UPI003C7B9A38
MKLYFKIAFLLLIFEILLGITDSYFFMNDVSVLGVNLSDVTGFGIYVLSMPIALFGRDLPFYHSETWIAIVLTVLNIAIQSFVILYIYRAFKN